MLKYLPFIVVVAFAIPLTVWQWSLLDWVWGENTPALQCAYLLQKEVPYEIGDWVGEDLPVTQDVLDITGADGYISRLYTNKTTNQQVSVWFIVGHFRQVSRHTPDFCSPAHGAKPAEPVAQYDFTIDELPTSTFKTSKFMWPEGNRVSYQRVFWAWWRPDELESGQSADDVSIVWSAPEDPRIKFGFCRVLYKLYFTAMSNEEERVGESVCLEFASQFLPVVHERLRKSGVVMGNDELPKDIDQVLKRPTSPGDEGQPTDQQPAATGETANEETEPAEAA